MRRTEPREGRRDRRGAVVEGARTLEELVRTVVVLDGARARLLLSGLSGAVRPASLEMLRRLEQCNRSERHAGLASAFASGPALLAAAAGIPGRLGAEVRASLTPDGSPGSPRAGSTTSRWARRLVLELGDEDSAVTPG